MGLLAQTMYGGIEYKPGDTVPASGIYTVRHDPSTTPVHEVTCIEGRRFPPSRTSPHPRFKLKYEAKHLGNHPDYDTSKY